MYSPGVPFAVTTGSADPALGAAGESGASRALKTRSIAA
jgi:hypothetical protein